MVEVVEDWWRRGELLAGDWPRGVVRCRRAVESLLSPGPV